jgi:hypothetical protein
MDTVAKIQTMNLSNASLQHYSYINLLGEKDIKMDRGEMRCDGVDYSQLVRLGSNSGLL